MRISRRHLLIGAGLLGLAGAVGCGNSNPGSSPGTLTVGLTYIPNVQFSPFYVAEQQGLFEDAGLDVVLRHHGEQEDLFTAVLSGQEDVVYASSDEAVVAAANGSSLQTFATLYQQYPGVILAADPTVASLQELAGQRLGVPGRFGSSWYAVLSAMSAAGMTEDDIDIVEIGFTQTSALSTGKVEAVVGFSNNETVQFNTIGFPVAELAVHDERAPSLVGPGLITVPERLHTDVLRSLVDAVLLAEELIEADPELALEATRVHVPTLDDGNQRANAQGILEASIELWKRDGQLSAQVNHDEMERMGHFLVEAGIIGEPPSETVLEL